MTPRSVEGPNSAPSTGMESVPSASRTKGPVAQLTCRRRWHAAGTARRLFVSACCSRKRVPLIAQNELEENTSGLPPIRAFTDCISCWLLLADRAPRLHHLLTTVGPLAF